MTEAALQDLLKRLARVEDALSDIGHWENTFLDESRFVLDKDEPTTQEPNT